MSRFLPLKCKCVRINKSVGRAKILYVTFVFSLWYQCQQLHWFVINFQKISLYWDIINIELMQALWIRHSHIDKFEIEIHIVFIINFFPCIYQKRCVGLSFNFCIICHLISYNRNLFSSNWISITFFFSHFILLHYYSRNLLKLHSENDDLHSQFKFDKENLFEKLIAIVHNRNEASRERMTLNTYHNL